MAMAPPSTAETIQLERTRLGLDQPQHVQFLNWIGRAVTGDLGHSMWTGKPVTEEIGLRIGLSNSGRVHGGACRHADRIAPRYVVGRFPGTAIDYGVRLLTVSGLAIPSFWFGMMIILLLLYFFNWAPPITYTPFWRDPVANMSQLFWPALAVGYRYAAVAARMVRSSLLEVLQEDYIRTARAKGVSERSIVLRHAMRNGLLPTVTVVGLEFAFLIGGLVATEQVFNLNEIGRLLVQAVLHNDFVMVQGIVMVLALIFMMTNLVVDLLVWLDPRIEFSQ